MIPDIPVVGGDGIPFIQVNGTGVKLIQTIRPTNTTIRPIGIGDISKRLLFHPMRLVTTGITHTIITG